MSTRISYGLGNQLTRDQDFTPRLLQLGLAKSQTSLVWIAPPLSGLIVQPIVGAVSDASKSRWGRRRPYILASSILAAVFLCIFGWATEIIEWFPVNENVVRSSFPGPCSKPNEFFRMKKQLWHWQYFAFTR